MQLVNLPRNDEERRQMEADAVHSIRKVPGYDNTPVEVSWSGPVLITKWKGGMTRTLTQIRPPASPPCDRPAS